MQKSKDAEVLNSIYRGAKTGCQSITDLMPKVDNTKFQSDLKTQEQEYVNISSQATNMLVGIGEEPDPVGTMKKLGMKMAIEMNTAVTSDTSYLAQLMIKGSTMGITNMTKVLNNYPNPKKEVEDLARQLITTEQQNIDRLKAYL